MVYDDHECPLLTLGKSRIPFCRGDVQFNMCSKPWSTQLVNITDITVVVVKKLLLVVSNHLKVQNRFNFTIC
jgi:hypothetical protein